MKLVLVAIWIADIILIQSFHLIGSGRQLQLFYMQRLLNGLHLLALLGGIYLMIFVVEPVAVPQSYLAQHFYGLPWSNDVSLHREPLANLPFTRRNSLQHDAVGGINRAQWILNVSSIFNSEY